MEAVDCKLECNRPRKVVVATSASPEVVSRESFVRRLEGMMDAPMSSSAVACVNCHKERGHHHGNNNSNNNNNNNNNSNNYYNSKRRSVGRNRGRGNSNINNNNNNSGGGNRKKQQQYHQQVKTNSPIVVHLKDSFRVKHSLMSASRFRQSSLDGDSDASSSKSTDEDQWTVGRRGEDDVQWSSLSEDLASSPETVSHLQNHYQHHMRPFKSDKSRKSFRGNHRLILSSKPRQSSGGMHQSYLHKMRDSSSRKNLTEFISEIEKAHRKEPAKNIEINLSGNSSDSKQSINNNNVLNNHSHCDCKDETLNNVCKCLLKDAEIKLKNVAECDNVDLICNDLYTSTEKLSEESTDESDTSDKASELSSSDALSDDARGTPPPVPRNNGRKFSAEELEELAEYTTGAPLVQYDCHPSQCLSCMNAVSSYPYYYSYFDGFESQPGSRYLYDYHSQDHLYHHYHLFHHNSYHRHHQYHHQRHHHHHHHHHHQRRFRYEHPLQQYNHWIIQRPRIFNSKLSSTNGPDYPNDVEENMKNIFSTSPSSSTTSPLSSSSPTMMTTSSNTVVTVCANGAFKSSGKFTSSKQRSLSESDKSIKASNDKPKPAEEGKDKKTSQPEEDSNGESTNCTNWESCDPEEHKDCSLSESVFMDLSGLDITFTVHYPGDQDHLSWPFDLGVHPNHTLPSAWVPPSVPYVTGKSHPSSSPSGRVPRLFKRPIPSPLTLASAMDSEDFTFSPSEIKKYELAMPSNRPWINVGSADKDLPAAVFTVMCYNVLSDKLCTKAMYGYCPTWALSWDYRKKGIMSDIISGNADIITLQEVETEQYYGLFLPELLKRGYDGVFLPKSRVRTMNSDKEKMSVDGCAIFYKKAKFEKVNEHHVEFSQLATKDGVTNTDSDMINRVSTKDNIAIVAMLRTKPAAYEGSPVPAPKGLSQMLMVSTAHIHWDPQLPDVKLVQTIMLVEELRKFIKEASMQFRPNAPPPAVDSDMCSSVPLILCGDFNSLPDSGVFEFLSKGKLDTRHRDFEGQNYKAFMKDRNENGILNHSFNLTSAYKDVIPFTNYTFDFKGVIDYIFYSGQHFRLHGVMGLQDEEWFRANKIVGCPHPFVPSDHFPLFAEFSLPAKSSQKPR